MQKNIAALLLIGGAIRFYLSTTPLATSAANRVEISTPLNSFKRVQEGIYLYKNGIDPYKGDVVHELPLVLLALKSLFESAPKLVPLLYICLDLVTALVLYKLAQRFLRSKLREQRKELSKYAANTEDLQFQQEDLDCIPRFVLLAYLFNPLSVANCVGLTSTVFSNLLLSLTLYCLVCDYMALCLIFLAVESMRNLYPVVLIAPVALAFTRKLSLTAVFPVVAAFGLWLFIIAHANYAIMRSWSFLDGTLGFIFFYRDLQPNIGLFWYFFTEMFEHFRTMFLITFQMNATVLYLVPLSLKLRKEPMLLATVLIALMSIFRSYPCLGDVSFYLALLPLWRRCWRFMAHNFVVFCFFITTLAMMPALWHLWIYSGSANANFYFGTTLAFSTGQIFLVTDLLFAYVKRDFCLHNGKKIYIDGKEAKIILE